MAKPTAFFSMHSPLCGLDFTRGAFLRSCFRLLGFSFTLFVFLCFCVILVRCFLLDREHERWAVLLEGAFFQLELHHFEWRRMAGETPVPDGMYPVGKRGLVVGLFSLANSFDNHITGHLVGFRQSHTLNGDKERNGEKKYSKHHPGTQSLAKRWQRSQALSQNAVPFFFLWQTPQYFPFFISFFVILAPRTGKIFGWQLAQSIHSVWVEWGK